MLSDLKDELCVGICGGCGILIQDRFYLLAADKQWHVSCLRCCECKTQLDSELTCFARNGNIYCKEDYYRRLYSIHRCGKCQIGISSRQLVMRVREYVYHLHCFTCTACHKPLNKGDQFGFRDGLIYCRSHYELILMELCPDNNPDFIWGTINTKVNSNSDQDIASNAEYDKPLVLKGRPRKRKCLSTTDHDDVTSNNNSDLIMNAELSSSMDSFTYDSSSINSPIGSGGSLLSLSLQQQQQQQQQQHQQQQRNKRMRTSFKHHQLRTMKSYFAINQNPDAKDLKQLAQKTGLSKRVLQVWFQNARAKWRRNAMRPESLSTSGNNISQIATNQSFNNDSPSSNNTINLMQAHHHPIQNGQQHAAKDKSDEKSESLSSTLPFLIQDIY